VSGFPSRWLENWKVLRPSLRKILIDVS
jgi:hypothetical protein